MKKAFVKVISVMLVVVITLTAAPLSGFVGLELPQWLDFSITSSAATISGACGENLTWSYNTSTYTLTISGTGEMYDYGYNNHPWKSYEYSIRYVVVNNGVTTIGEYAFAYCNNLIKVTIGDSVTTIGERAFHSCDSLTSVTIPDSVTTIGSYAFEDCTNIKNVFINDVAAWCNITFGGKLSNPLIYGGCLFLNGDKVIDLVITDGVTKINGYAFSGCSSLTSVTIPDSVKTIGEYAFYSCDSLTNITIPDGVATIGNYVFYSCDSLTSVTIPDSVTTIGEYAFYSCDSLTSVTIPDSVITIGERAFYNTGYYNDNNNWENDILYINNHLIDAKTSISGDYEIKEGTITIDYWAFSSCDSLTSVTIPDSVITIGESAFYSCDSLTSVTIGDSVTTIGDSVTTIGNYAFEDCTSLTSVTIGDSVTTIGDYAFRDCDSLISVAIGDSVTIIGNSAFSGCTSLTSVTIPDSLKTIGSNAFYNCIGIEDITIGDSVTSIGAYAFEKCTNIKKVYIRDVAAWCNITFGYEYRGVLSNPLYNGGHLFLNGDKITDLVIPDGVTKINDYAFYNCISITSVTIPDSVTSIGKEAFYGCSYIEEVNISDISSWCNITFNSSYSNPLSYSKKLILNGEKVADLVIPDDVTSINDYAFRNCDSLTSVTIPDSVTSIGKEAFYRCTYLTNVITGDGATSIGDYAFYDCDRLTDVIIGDSVTTIGRRAFYECRNLENVTMGKSIKSIDNEAFYYCVGIRKVNISDISAWCNIDFDNGASNPLNCGNCSISYYRTTLVLNGKTVTNLVIPEDVTELKDYTFGRCSSITSVTIPDSVTSVGNNAFGGCSKLSDVYYYGTEKQWNNIIIEENNSTLINATIHYNYDPVSHYNAVITPPTCTEQGYTTYTCACGDSYIDNYVKATGHSYTAEITTPATHTSKGVMTYTCACGDTYTEVINKTYTHSYEEVVTPPTCTRQGYTTYTCECGSTYKSNYVYALGHTDGDVVEENYVAPTCTANGSKDNVTYCTACGIETSREKVVISATGHKYVNGKCEYCGDKDVYYYNGTFHIQTPSTTTIRHKDGIKLHATVEGTAPKGSYIEWTASNSNFKTEEINDGNSLQIVSDKNGNTTFTATLYSEDGEVLATDTIEMKSKAGFFDKISSFFRLLFGKPTIHEQ